MYTLMNFLSCQCKLNEQTSGREIQQFTVGENNIGSPKMQNDCVDVKLLLPHNLLCLIFGISSLHLF